MLKQERIDQIVQQVMSELQQGERVRMGSAPVKVEKASPPPPSPVIKHSGNLFEDVDGAVAAARLAYEQLNQLPLSIREEMKSTPKSPWALPINCWKKNVEIWTS